VWCGARSRVYRLVRLSHAVPLGGTVDADGLWAAPGRPTGVMPWLKRPVDALRKAAPQAFGGCRTRWRWATLACDLQATQRLAVSAGTGRCGLHASGWGWKRATVVAKENDPPRGERLARLRWQREPWPAHALVVCADARARHLWSTVGAAWRPRGRQEAGMTPGQNANHSLAGALQLVLGTILPGLGPRSSRAGVALRSETMTRGIQPQQARSGGPPIRAWRCCGYRPLAREPILASGPWAMGTIRAHGTTHARAEAP
jgi:hypothetical protein